MWRWIATLLLISMPISACGALDGHENDFWGNTYPPQCNGSLDDVILPIQIVPHEKMPPGRLGECINCDKLVGAYAIVDDWMRDDPHGKKYRTEVIKHEKCHRKMWLLGFSPYWHKIS